MRHQAHILFKAVLSILFLAAPLAANGQAIRYRVVPLPEIVTPVTSCVPTAINENGDVVGYCNAGGDAGAVLWRNGTVTDLGKFDRGTFSKAWAINNAGQIVGEGDDGDGIPMALVNRNGSWIVVEGSGGSSRNAYGVTDDGTVFGNFTSTGSPGTQDWDPVFWTYDAAGDRYDRFDLPKAQGNTFTGAFVYAASRTGIAVGQLATDLLPGPRAALWSNDAGHSLVVLDLPAGFSQAALAFGVSDDGRAAGYAVASIVSETAVLWLNDATHTAVNIGALPGHSFGQARGVNNAGRVVGVSYPSRQTVGEGFVYFGGTLTALSDVLDASSAGWTINEAVGINNAGQIIATGTLNGLRHPVLLEPVDPGTITSVTLVAAPPSPQNLGATITFTATAEGGASPHQFKWQVSDGSATTVVQDWNESDTYAWTPTAAGSYQVTVSARSAGSTAEDGEQSASMSFVIAVPLGNVTLDANPGSPQMAGTEIEFIAGASGGTEPYQFKFLVSDGTTREWSSTNTFRWTPASANAYEVTVWLRSAGNSADEPEAQRSLWFDVTRRLVTGLTLVADRTSPQLAGTSILLTATASGGTEPYAYKFLLSDGTVLREWGANTLSWTPQLAGNYTLVVWARGEGNTENVAEKTASVPFAITRAVITAVTVSSDRTPPQPPGTAITFVATATGGTTPYQFKWLVSDGTTSVVAQDWGPAATFTWTPMTANANYQVTVWARGAGNTEDAFEEAVVVNFPIVASVEPPHDNRDGLKPLPGRRLGKGAPEYSPRGQ